MTAVICWSAASVLVVWIATPRHWKSRNRTARGYSGSGGASRSVLRVSATLGTRPPAIGLPQHPTFCQFLEERLQWEHAERAVLEFLEYPV